VALENAKRLGVRQHFCGVPARRRLALWNMAANPNGSSRRESAHYFSGEF